MVSQIFTNLVGSYNVLEADLEYSAALVPGRLRRSTVPVVVVPPPSLILIIIWNITIVIHNKN
mgnify:CR=1 FL=1